MSSIRKREFVDKRGRPTVRYDVTVTQLSPHTGEQIRCSKSFRQQTAATAWARRREVEIERGDYPPVDRAPETPAPSIEQALQWYLEEVAPKLKSGTSEPGRAHNLVRLLGEMDSDKLEPHHLASYRDQRLAEKALRPNRTSAGIVLVETNRQVGPQTVKHELGLLARALHHAIERHGVRLPHSVPRLTAQRGEGRALRLPRARDRLLSKVEHEALKAACSTEAPDDGKAYAGLRTARRSELWLALMFAGVTSARQSELCNLRWQDVSEESVTFRDTKNGTDRSIPIWDEVRRILAQLPSKRPPEARVFGYTAGGLRQAFRRARDRAGLKNFRFHDLRHCAATELASKLGGDPFLLCQVTGHKSLAAVKRYVNDRSQEILAALNEPK